MTDVALAKTLSCAHWQSIVVPPQAMTIFSIPLCFTSFDFLSRIIGYCTDVLHVDVTGVVPFNLVFDITGHITGKLGGFANAHIEYVQHDLLGIMRLQQVS